MKEMVEAHGFHKCQTGCAGAIYKNGKGDKVELKQSGKFVLYANNKKIIGNADILERTLIANGF